VGAGGEGGDQLASAADPEFVEHCVEMFLENVGRDLKLFDDGGGGLSLKNQRHDTTQGGGKAVGCLDQRAHMAGIGGIQDYRDLRISPWWVTFVIPDWGPARSSVQIVGAAHDTVPMG
jgi:hypothetical protein